MADVNDPGEDRIPVLPEPRLGRFNELAAAAVPLDSWGGWQFALENQQLGSVYRPPVKGYLPRLIDGTWYWVRGQQAPPEQELPSAALSGQLAGGSPTPGESFFASQALEEAGAVMSGEEADALREDLRAACRKLREIALTNYDDELVDFLRSFAVGRQVVGED